MKLAAKARRRTDPTKGARVLLVEPDARELDRVGDALRAAGFKVVALSRPDALLPLSRVFRPELAVFGIHGPELELARVGRRLSRRFKGRVPILYLGDLKTAEERQFCLENGQGLDVLPRASVQTELPARVKQLLHWKLSVENALRAQFEERSPSLHDDVTGLYNRSFLLEMVAAEARRTARHGGSFTVMMAELDDFLAVRERYGDEVCDRLMVYCSVLLRQALREADVLARVGRYHFGALMPAMPEEAVAGVLERLERRFNLAHFQLDGQRIRASMTLATATFPDEVGTPQQLFSRAIQELDRVREVKRARGNKKHAPAFGGRGGQ